MARKHLRRQPGRERAAARLDQEDVVAFLDARRRQPDLSEHTDADSRRGAEPRPSSRRDLAPDHEHGRDDEDRVAKEVVDRKPECREHQHERRELQPRLRRRSISCRVDVPDRARIGRRG